MATPYFKRARAERLVKGLTQAEAGRLYGKPQSFIARLESGALENRAEEREYYLWLKKRRKRRDRFSGGKYRVGPKRNRPKDPSRYRGTPLHGDKYYEDKLEQAGWKLLAMTRTADDMDVAFAYRGQTDEFAMIGFVQRDGTHDLDMIPPIRFSPKWDDNSGDALEAFGAGRFPDSVYDKAMGQFEDIEELTDESEQSEEDEESEDALRS